MILNNEITRMLLTDTKMIKKATKVEQDLYYQCIIKRDNYSSNQYEAPHYIQPSRQPLENSMKKENKK